MEDLARLQQMTLPVSSIMKEDATATVSLRCTWCQWCNSGNYKARSLKVQVRFQPVLKLLILLPDKRGEMDDPITYMNMLTRLSIHVTRLPARYSQQKIIIQLPALNLMCSPAADWYSVDMLLKNHNQTYVVI